MSITDKILSQCPFNDISNLFSQFSNTVHYFNSDDPLQFITEMLLKNGNENFSDIATFPFNHKCRFAVISNQEMIAEQLRKYRFDGVFGESAEFRALTKGIGGKSPLTCQNNDEHIALRKAYKESTFSTQNVREMAPTIACEALDFISENFQEGLVYNAPETMLRYSLSQALKNLVKSEADIDLKDLAQIVQEVEQFVTNEILWKLPASILPSKWDAINRLEDTVRTIVEGESHGLVNDLKEMENEETIRSAAKTAIVIGSGTTRSSLVSTLYCLLKHPEEQEKLYRAILAKIDVANDEDLLSASWDSCVELKHFVQEVLRLYPPILFLARKTQEPVVSGFCNEEKKSTISDQTSLYLSIYHTHRRTDTWNNAEEFKPERFDEKGHQGRLFAFSYGSTRCLGEHFALAVIYSIIGPLLCKYRLEWPMGDDGAPIEQNLKIRSGMTLQFDKDLKFRLVPRP